VNKVADTWRVKSLENIDENLSQVGFKTKKEAVEYAKKNEDAVLERLKEASEAGKAPAKAEPIPGSIGVEFNSKVYACYPKMIRRGKASWKRVYCRRIDK
jgi:hypothetical protein